MCLSGISLSDELSSILRLRTVSFDENEAVFSCLNSGILHLNLSPDEVSYLCGYLDMRRDPSFLLPGVSITEKRTKLSLSNIR